MKLSYSPVGDEISLLDWEMGLGENEFYCIFCY
jgi:hypothetical protein